MPITIAHVAKKAKVSKTTVSRVLSKTPGFKYSEETCKKVFATAKSMGYSPSSAAQLMRLKDIKMVGICIQANNSIISYSVLENLSLAVKELGYYPILIDLNESFELFGSPHLHRLDYMCGIICLYTSQVGAVQKLCSKYHKQLPIVSLGSNSEPGDNVRVVATDHNYGIGLAVKYLCDHGHKNILLGFIDEGKIGTKLQGFKDKIKKCGVDGKTLALQNNVTYEMGKEIAEYIDKNPELTAVLCSNDEVAMGVISYLGKNGIKVPDDISVIGYDDLPFAAYTSPSLTTIKQNVKEVASVSAKVLISSIEGTAVHNNFIPSCTKIQPELIIRESTKTITK